MHDTNIILIFELYHKTVCKEDSSKTKTKKPETFKTLEKAH